jgi:dTDP-4-amino-4,6-dideoxygalactose transaminase
MAALVGGAAIAVASGRGAIALALRLSGLAAPADEVIVTGYTCVAVPAGVLAGGGRPRYADVDPGTGNMSPATVAMQMTERTGAVVVQHLLGNPAPTRAIRDASRPGIWIVEDAAHALGSRVGDDLVGQHGDWAIYSTEQSKSLSTGQGGILVAVSDRARERLETFAGSGRTWSRSRTRRWLIRIGAERLAFGFVPAGRPQPGQILVRLLHRSGLASVSSRDEAELAGGMPAWRLAMLPDQLAEIGVRQLARLDAILDHRRSVAARYEQTLDGIGQRLAVEPDARPVWLRYPVLVDDADSVGPAMRERGWSLGGRWFGTPIYPSDADPLRVGYVPGSCPQAERLAGRMLNLPTHPLVSERLADRLAADLRRVLGA